MEIKKIILNGCSYVHGCDITFKENNIAPWANFYESSKNWSETQWTEFNSVNLSGQLKETLGCNDIINLAEPGISNESISSKTIDYINTNWSSIDPETTLVMIGWTDFCRTIIYNEKIGYFNYSIPHVSNYLRVFQDEQPKTKNLETRIEFLNNLKGLENYYSTDMAATITDYYRHINLILMLQFYLNSKGLKFIFWNSLINFPRMTFEKNKHISPYAGIENLVDWSKWAPAGNQQSYENSWEELIVTDQKYITETRHPSKDGVKVWTNLLVKVIRDMN